ncbi:Tn3 family transposase [Pelosinus baikalensis]|uniref:Tn3 family transposase n=1 Tax=Pelosinus baikalensis TaxID=2892015 RepID=A0ABS8HZS6_9FIRM|nr:Tn3 family transposase [Pelosinus baikalensis]MCC5468645.1 Tn3 family transposase [Pelosinus baikalensis]
MPVEFLTSEQKDQYGQFTVEPSPEQLAKYFLFDDHDRSLIFRHRGQHNRLGFAIQLGTLRFLGTFLSDPTEVPVNVYQYVAKQLNIDIGDLACYRDGESRWDHTSEICKAFGYTYFNDQPIHWKLVRWLYTRAWLSTERPSILFDITTARCVDQKIILPGVTILERLISQVRDRANLMLWKKLSHLPNSEQRNRLENILKPDSQHRQSVLDLLRRSPTNPSVSGLLKAIERLKVIRSLGAQNWNLSHIPIGRIRMLARYASMAMEQVFSTMARGANRKDEKTRLRTIRDLDSAARKLGEACSLLLDENVSATDLRKIIFSKIPKNDLESSVQTVASLTKPQGQTVAFDELFRNYSTVRRYLPKLMETLQFYANSAGQSAVRIWEFLAASESKSGKHKYSDAPLDGISPFWRKLVTKDLTNTIDPCGYTFWAIDRMYDALKKHDIYVRDSQHYGDPREQLLQGSAWETARPQILRMLEWPSSAEEALEPLAKELDQAYRKAAERWADNPVVRIESFAGHDRLILSPLDKLEESESVKILRNQVRSLLPRIDLPELILEVDQWTNFTAAFTHISQGDSRMKDLNISSCAILIARSCNIGLDPVVKPSISSLEYDRLTWVEQNYFRTETITKANAALVAYHAPLELAQVWGGGEVASADGLRFVIPVKTIHSGPNPKYFGAGRGVTYYNFTSDQFMGFHGIVIPGTIRDSLYLLEGILEQQTVLQPKEIMTDTAGYSDIIFGLFGLLGYQFSPRIADVGSLRFWRFDPNADYGELNKLAKHRIRKDIIGRYWDDMLRVAGSLKLGTVNSTQLIRTLQRDGKPTMLARVIGELGRIFKTKHLLMVMDDPNYRRKILTQLNRGESRHNLARNVFYGKKGELHQAYREGQEDQLGALGLVVNAIILWNTRYMAIALDALRKEGKTIDEADVQRLSPLGFDHINIVGRYSFHLPKEIEHGALRPLMKIDIK